MAVGDLSPDQARYVDIVASATGLARTVVVAWVGAESGWGINKAGHNYLNVGPGETFPSVEQAAARAAGLVNASNRYTGIRTAIPAGPGAQAQAIGASPWGTNPTLLSSVYGQLAGTTTADGTPTIQDVGFWEDQWQGFLDSFGVTIGGHPEKALPYLGDAAKAAGGALGLDAGAIVGAGLTLVFTVAAFAVIAMAVNRLTGAPPKGVFDTVSGAVGAATGAAKLAAV